VLEELGPSDPAHLVPPELRERFGWLIADMWETSRAVAEQMLASCKAEAEAAERTASEKVEALTRKVNELAQENRDLQAALIDRSQQLDIAKGRERDALIGEADARRSAAANEMARRAAAAYVKELEDRLQHSNRRLDELIARVPTKEMGDNFGDALAPFQPIEP
jgi:septal ring factor EnvC (AmiA/AmiB activator)